MCVCVCVLLRICVYLYTCSKEGADFAEYVSGQIDPTLNHRTSHDDVCELCVFVCVCLFACVCERE